MKCNEFIKGGAGQARGSAIKLDFCRSEFLWERLPGPMAALFHFFFPLWKRGQGDFEKDVIDNFTDRAKRETVLGKYAAPGVVPQELTLCDMAKPVINKTEEKEGITYYTLESRVEKCEHSPAAVGTVRIFAVGWKNGKITKFVWGGPKGGKVEY